LKGEVMLKSAYEIAMEKSGMGEVKKLSKETKLALAGVDAEYKKKIEETDFNFSQSIQSARQEGEEERVSLLEEEWSTARSKLIKERDEKKRVLREN